MQKKILYIGLGFWLTAIILWIINTISCLALASRMESDLVMLTITATLGLAWIIVLMYLYMRSLTQFMSQNKIKLIAIAWLFAIVGFKLFSDTMMLNSSLGIEMLHFDFFRGRVWSVIMLVVSMSPFVLLDMKSK